MIRLAQLELIFGFQLSDGIDDLACASLVFLNRGGEREVEGLVRGELDLEITTFRNLADEPVSKVANEKSTHVAGLEVMHVDVDLAVNTLLSGIHRPDGTPSSRPISRSQRMIID